MGIKLARTKKRTLLLTAIYRLSKLPFASRRLKFKLFLNLEWIFDRLSMEYSYKVYSPDEHPSRKFTKDFLMKFIRPVDTVLDLGSNTGDISYFIAEKAKHVVGIDYNESLVALAKKQKIKDNLEFCHGEAHQFLLSNKRQFDVLILSHILEHIDDPKDFLDKFKHFFNYIYIELPDFDKTYLNHYRKDMGLSLIYTDNDHVTEFDRHELKQLLSGCNIEILDSEYRFGIQKLWCKVNK